jgi:hypothetical protein
MAYSTVLTDYLGEGPIGSRPATLNIAATALGFYYATDTAALSAWNGSAWVAASGSGVTDVATSGSGISGGPITSTGTLAVEWNAGTVSAIGPGLTISAGSLQATASAPEWIAGTVAAIDATLSIAAGGTLGAVIPAAEWNAGSVTAIGTGLTLAAGSLEATAAAPEWTAGTATAVATGLTIASAVLTPNWQAGTVSAVGTGLTIAAGGSLQATGVGVSAANGVAINSGTVSIINASTLVGTISGTTTIGPATGTSDVIVHMPTTAGMVTLAAAPQFARQRVLLDIVYGATVSTPALNSGFVFSSGPSAYVPGTIAGSVDRMELMSPNGVSWVVLAIGQGSTI